MNFPWKPHQERARCQDWLISSLWFLVESHLKTPNAETHSVSLVFTFNSMSEHQLILSCWISHFVLFCLSFALISHSVHHKDTYRYGPYCRNRGVSRSISGAVTHDEASKCHLKQYICASVFAFRVTWGIHVQDWHRCCLCGQKAVSQLGFSNGAECLTAFNMHTNTCLHTLLIRLPW